MASGGLSEVDAATLTAGEPLVHYRNELIARLMQRAGLCRKLGSGLQSAREALECSGNPIEFKIDPAQFHVTVYLQGGEPQISTSNHSFASIHGVS